MSTNTIDAEKLLKNIFLSRTLTAEQKAELVDELEKNGQLGENHVQMISEALSKDAEILQKEIAELEEVRDERAAATAGDEELMETRSQEILEMNDAEMEEVTSTVGTELKKIDSKTEKSIEGDVKGAEESQADQIREFLKNDPSQQGAGETVPPASQD